MDQFILFKTIVSMFDKDAIVEVYTKDDNEPWFANRAYLLSSIAENHEDLYVNMDMLKISSKFAGYDKSHITITTEDELPYVEQKQEWWDRLRLATLEEIKEEITHIMKSFLFEKIKASCNEVAIAAMESGECDDAIQEAMKQIDYDHIAMSGFTKLDMINARSNPTNSEFYNAIVNAIKTTMSGEDGKAFQDILFG